MADIAPLIPPAAYRAALRQDYYPAHAATGDDVLAHLWALESALDDVAGSDDPRTEARYLAAAIHATLTVALRRRGR
jgi:hypothetical protein